MRYKKLLNEDNKKKSNQAATDILNAATALFVEKGYCSVTVRDIATKAGVNQALIPYYYTSKDHLANRVYLRIAEDVYKKISSDFTELKQFGSAEFMYLCTILSFKYLSQYCYQFYTEFMEFCHENYTPSQFITQLSQKVIQEYQLPVTPAENDLYLTTLIGAERFMITRRNRKEIDFSDEYLVNIMLSNYFFNLTLPDQTIADIITQSCNYLKMHHFL